MAGNNYAAALRVGQKGKVYILTPLFVAARVSGLKAPHRPPGRSGVKQCALSVGV